MSNSLEGVDKMDMIVIRPAREDEYEPIKKFYHSLIDAMSNAEFKPGWKKEIYPTSEFLSESVRNGELYIGLTEGELVSCMVLNHECNEGYKKIRWSVHAENKKILFIHALGVAPAFGGRGIAKYMVQKAVETAQKHNMKAIRLDVLQGNIPAMKLYTKMGFQHMGTVRMFYEDTGWTNYEMFEADVMRNRDLDL